MLRWLPFTFATGPGALSLAWVLGCACQLQQAALWPRWVYGLLASLAVAAVAHTPGPGRRRAPVARVALLLVATGLLAFASTGWRAQDRADQAWPAALDGQDLLLEGHIDSLPQATEFGQRFEFAVDTARFADPDLKAPVPRLHRVQLAWYAGGDRTTAVLRAGDRWRILVRLRAPHGLANPWGFDAELAAWERGLQAQGYVRQPARVLPASALDGTAPPAAGAPVLLSPAALGSIGAVRQAVRDAILAGVPDRGVAGVLAALVVGDQGAILAADWDLFRATGIAHLVSISGLHVTAFAWLAALALGAAWRRLPRLCEAWPAPWAASAGGLLLAAAYAAFSGGGVPAQRTVGMLAVVALLRISGRRWPWPAAWALVAAGVSAWDPWALLQPGFWLSFVAVGALMAAGAPPSTSRASRWALLLREQAVVTLALAPLTLLLFGQLSWVGLLANLIAIPWMTCVVLPLALAGVAWPPLWQLAAWGVQALALPLQAIADWPGAVLVLPAAPAPMAAAAIAGALLAVLRLPFSLRAASLPLVLPLLLWQPPRPAAGRFELLAVDVGQGQAVLVRTARHALLYDAGPRWSEELDAGQRVLVPGLRALGVRLDRLVVSHPDSDHAGGARAVLVDHPAADLLASLPAGHPLAAHRPPQPCLAGQRWLWDGVRFEVLHPREEDFTRDPSLRQANAHSCVLRVVDAQGVSALLPGDLEAAQERRLVAADAETGGADLRADLLLVPHHGSRTSSTEAFLDAVRPRLALVQAGWRNRYGHPASVVMARYAARGIAVMETPTCGALRWSSEAPGQAACFRAESPRYWRHPMEAPAPAGSAKAPPSPSP